MELVDGEDLDRRMRRAGPLPSDDVARIGSEVAAALAAAHRHGVLHRDVKPKNILLDRDGRARLTDFGSARMDGDATITRTGAIVGTLAYMAPETAAGRRGDARSDVFALGMTLFHAAAGRLPDRPSPHLPLPSSATRVHADRASTPTSPCGSAHVIARATCADPADRYPTPTALADALTNRDVRIEAGSRALRSRPVRPLRRRSTCLGTAVCPACTSGVAALPMRSCSCTSPRSTVERDQATRHDGGVARPGRRGRDARRGDDRRAGHSCACRPSRAAGSSAARGARTSARTSFASESCGARFRPVSCSWWRWSSLSASSLASTVDRAARRRCGSVRAPAGGGRVMSIRRPALTSSAAGVRALGRDARRASPRRSLHFLPARRARCSRTSFDAVRRCDARLALRQDSSGIGATVDDLLDARVRVGARCRRRSTRASAQFDRERSRDDGNSAWLDSLAECERTRDVAVQRLLDAVTVLGQLDTQSIRGFEDVNARLGELVAEIASEVKARSATREEMESLLARSRVQGQGDSGSEPFESLRRVPELKGSDPVDCAVASRSSDRTHDVLPLRRIRPRDDRDDRLHVAHVEHLVRHAGLDEDEIAGLVLDDLPKPRPVLVAHVALEDVEHHLEVDVDVRVGDAARRNRRDVHRQLRRADVLRRQAGAVANAVPAAHAAAAADDGDPVAALDVLLEVQLGLRW